MGTENRIAGHGCRAFSENVCSQSAAIRVLIADDHAVVRAGFSTVCQDAGLTVVGLAKNDEEILKVVRDSVVDVLLLDVRIDRFIEVGDLIQKFGPRARVIALSSFEPDDLVCIAVEAGAVGFLLKDSSRSHIVETIEAVYADENCLPRWIGARIAEKKAR